MKTKLINESLIYKQKLIIDVIVPVCKVVDES